MFSSALSQNNVIADTMMIAAIGGTASVVVRDPVSNQQIGVELKTSWLDTIFLNSQQVNFDVAVVNGTLGPALGSEGVLITGVHYYTYCFQCLSGEALLRSYVLQGKLELAGILTYSGRRLFH